MQMRMLIPALVIVSAASHAQTVTFSEHIAPIIFANCSTCHRPGQVAPFSLLTYTDVLTHGLTIAGVTQSRLMPPWKPEVGWVPLRAVRRLTDDQIALIQQWVAEGMPQGDPSKTPPTPTFSSDWALGPPDLILEMPEAFNIPAEGPDIYRNFALPTNFGQDKWVVAVDLKPSAPQVVHHTLFYTDTTGAALALNGQDGQPGFPGLGTVLTTTEVANAVTGGLGAWANGITPQFLPAGIAMSLPSNAAVLLQMHFHLNGAAQTEKSRVGIYFGPKPDRDLSQIQVPAFWGYHANIDIPAGDANFKIRGSFTLPVDVDAVSVAAHSHYLGKSGKLTATLPSGEVKILLWIKQWDFAWQDMYLFQDLVYLPKGTRLDGEYTYDNSDANLQNPSYPPKEVKWGEYSTDEMGSLILNVVPHQASDLGTLRAVVNSYIESPALAVNSNPLFVSSAVVDGASTLAGAVTPGEILVLYGEHMGPSSLTQAQLTGDGRVSTSLGGTQVFFDGTPAPMLYASGGQLGAVVPYEINGQLGTQVQVRSMDGSSDLVALPVVQTAPSVFSINLTGTGQGAIVNQDGVTVNSSKNPAAKGSVVSIFATGAGQTTPGGLDGKIATAGYLPMPAAAVTVQINGEQAEVLYAGASPGSVSGLLQVNVRIPADSPSGDVPVVVQIGGFQSQAGVTVAVQ